MGPGRDAGGDLDRIRLDLLPRSASIPALPPFQLAVDLLEINGQIGGQAFDNGGKSRAMRLARS